MMLASVLDSLLTFYLGLTPASLALAFPSRPQNKEQNHRSHQNKYGDKLSGAHLSTGNEAALIASKTLHKEASGAVQNQIPEEDLSFELPLSVEKDQDQENGE